MLYRFCCLFLCLLLVPCMQQTPPGETEDLPSTYLTENALEHMSRFDAFSAILDVGPRPGVYVVRDDGTLWSGLYDMCSSGRNDYDNIWGKVLDGPLKFLHVGQWGASALTEDGILWSWGDYMYSPLGREKGEHTELPGQVLTDVRQVDMTYYTAAAVKEDDTLWVWGGFGMRVPFPEQVMEGVLCASVSDYRPILALKRDGTLWSIKGEPNEDGSAVVYTIAQVVYNETGELVETATGLRDGIFCTGNGTYWAVREVEGSVRAYPTEYPDKTDGGVAHWVHGTYGYAYIDEEDRLWAGVEDHTNANIVGIYGNEVTEPFLLDEDVIYADAADLWIFYIKSDGTLWLMDVPKCSEDGSNPFGQPELVLDHIMLPQT